MPDQKNKYTVIRDTREQVGKGWEFDKKLNCLGMVSKKLDTGDYSLLGYEKLFTLERKGSIAEFAGNLFEKRFERELQRMTKIPHAFIILEFEVIDLYHWPESSDIPYKLRQYVKTTPALLVKRMFEFQIKYPNVKILFAGQYGKELASSIFKRVTELVEK